MSKLLELLKPIKERLEAATPGPWRARPDIGSIHGPDGKAIQTGGEYFKGEEPMANAELIANAPADIELLLAVVEVQAKALDYAEAQLKGFGQIDPFIKKAQAGVMRILGGDGE